MLELLLGGQEHAIRAKVNEIIGWINARKAKEKQEAEEKERNREPKKDRTEEISEKIGECLRVYRDRRNDLKGYLFRRNFRWLDGSMEVVIEPYGDDLRNFDVTVSVRS